MTTNQQQPDNESVKPLSQAERAKLLIAQRKQGGNKASGKGSKSTETLEMKSQNTKRVNNQRKKMGV